jgi:hypothetical protein
MVHDKIDNDKQMCLHCRPFWWPCRRVEAMNVASSNAANPGPHLMPLEAVIGRVLAPYRPSGRQGNRQTKNNQQIHLKRWPCSWLQWCAGTIPRALPNGGGPGLYWKPTGRRHGASIMYNKMNRTWLRRFFWMCIHRQNRRKRSRVNAKAPVFNWGSTYQMKEKGLTKMSV